jgi:hypothetical protein
MSAATRSISTPNQCRSRRTSSSSSTPSFERSRPRIESCTIAGVRPDGCSSKIASRRSRSARNSAAVSRVMYDLQLPRRALQGDDGVKRHAAERRRCRRRNSPTNPNDGRRGETRTRTRSARGATRRPRPAAERTRSAAGSLDASAAHGHDDTSPRHGSRLPPAPHPRSRTRVVPRRGPVACWAPLTPVAMPAEGPEPRQNTSGCSVHCYILKKYGAQAGPASTTKYFKM